MRVYKEQSGTHLTALNTNIIILSANELPFT